MKRLVRFVMAASALALLPAGLYAQGDATITGTVTEQNTQQPVQGAQVVVVGTQRGAMTDETGRYSIPGVPAGTHDVRARRVGYAPVVQQVTVGAGMSATVDFALTVSATTLDEVVVNAVTGQEQRRAELGVNTGNVNVAELNKGPITKFSDVLQGRVPGVTVQDAVGTTGGSQRIRIRGANSLSLSNEPLYYIDGVLASNSRGGFALGGQDYSRVSDINPNEVENIEILKGPAASALYGSAAANGVILITTRKGRPGRTVWRVYAEGAQMEDENDYPLNYAALTQFTAGAPFYDIPAGGYLNIRSIFGDATRPYEICPNYRAGIPEGQTVLGQTRCSQDVLLAFDQFRDARTTPFEKGARGKVGINVSGGSEGLTYFLSGDRERENGVLRPNDLTRTSVRTNLQATLGSKVNAGVTASYIQSKTNRISNDNSIFSPLINALLGTAEYLPGMESGEVESAGSRLGSYFGYNTFDQKKVMAHQDVDRFMIGSNINFTPVHWLRLNANGGLDYFGRFDQFSMDPNVLPLAESYILGFRNATRASNYLWTAHGSGTGTFSLTPDILSNTTLGTSYQRGLFQSNFCYGEGIPTGTRSCAATTSKFAVDESQTDQITVGVFARQELAFFDRLFLAGSIRGDNNSGLTQDQTGLTYYPSFNASWVLSSEPFFPTLNWLSQVRLRAGWGQAGQRPGFGDAETFFAPVAVQSGGVELPALILSRTGNRGLKVERTTEIEGGFDLGFLDDRVTADFTAFQRVARDALISRPLPPSGGLTATVFQNLGRIKNWGTEMGLNANGITIGPRVRLDARFTATTLDNRIEALGEGIAPIVFNRGAQAHRENFPTGAFYALPIKYNDADGNGLLTRAEVSVDSSKRLIVPDGEGGLDTLNTAFAGPQLPTNTQTFNLDVTLFNNVTVTTLFERRAGHKQLNYTEYFRCRQQAGNAFHSQCGALSNPNASLEEQAAFIGAAFLSATPYGYIEDATFVKWRELSLRFTVPESVSSRFQPLAGASVTLSGRNLATWTDYRGLDPEINESGGGANFTQGEFNTQPPVRVYSLRFDFQLR